MIFIRLAQVVAWLGLFLGAARIALGFVVASSPEMQARYLGSATSGEAIDQGILWVVAAIAIGVLSEIGVAVRRVALDDN